MLLFILPILFFDVYFSILKGMKGGMFYLLWLLLVVVKILIL